MQKTEAVEMVRKFWTIRDFCAGSSLSIGAVNRKFAKFGGWQAIKNEIIAARIAKLPEGLNRFEVAAIFGITYQNAYAVCRKFGYRAAAAKGKPRPWMRNRCDIPNRNPGLHCLARIYNKSLGWVHDQRQAGAPRNVHSFFQWYLERKVEKIARRGAFEAFGRARDIRRGVERVKLRRAIDPAFHEKLKAKCRENYRTRLAKDPRWLADKRKRERATPQGKLRHNLRNRLYDLVKRKKTAIKFESALKLVGCTLDELKRHIESQFERGMRWENHGDWHIDHIVPVSKFDLTDISQQRKCFHYLNLRPLWAEDNLSKSDQIFEPVQLALTQ